MSELESAFTRKVVKEIKKRYPNALVLRAGFFVQGFPDRLILNGPNWAAIEFKIKETASKRPNQDFYVNLLNNMSFARFANPENIDEVLHDLQEVLTK